jgi:hypothetical protein
MAIEVSCRKCGKEYRVREERAGTEIRCKECQATIAVPSVAYEEDVDEFGGEASWDQEQPRSLPGRSRSSPVKVASSVATFTARKVFGVLALMLAAVMCLGVAMQMLHGNFRSLSGLVVVGAVGDVGLKWLRT